MLKLKDDNDDYEIDDLNMIGIKTEEEKPKKKRFKKQTTKMSFTDIVLQAKKSIRNSKPKTSGSKSIYFCNLNLFSI